MKIKHWEQIIYGFALFIVLISFLILAIGFIVQIIYSFLHYPEFTVALLGIMCWVGLFIWAIRKIERGNK